MIFSAIANILFIVIYSLILWGIFKLIALIRKEKLELNKKILFISAGIGAIGGILMLLLMFLLSDLDIDPLPIGFIDRFEVSVGILVPVFFLSSSLLFLSFILFKKFYPTWKDIKMRLFYLILAMIVYGSIPILVGFLRISFSEPITPQSLLESVYDPFRWFLAMGLAGGIIAFKYFIFFAVPTAFIITSGVKKIVWRIVLMIILIILICFAAGPTIGLMGFS